MIILAYFLLSSLPTSWIGLAMLFAGGTLLYVAALDALPDVHDPETEQATCSWCWGRCCHDRRACVGRASWLGPWPLISGCAWAAKEGTPCGSTLRRPHTKLV